ncbi:ELMO domain-containing protein A isoform X1 [Carex littledalei]|uniref:ELMO domain-containing protein A isoform X1 n=1 Tax=Carex littledalei TaxID=544730 RepID=A0A833QAS2_9POAL|nr:ELMO domain-containing protein A isoform X1 [Carex littledalei]
MDTSSADGLDEPLLGSYGDGSKEYDSREEEDWDFRKKVEQQWTFLFSTLIAQWAQWFDREVPAMEDRVLISCERYSCGKSSIITSSTLQEEGRVFNQNSARKTGKSGACCFGAGCAAVQAMAS